MGVSGGDQEQQLMKMACELQDPLKVPAFIKELLSVPDLDVVALYVRLEKLYSLWSNYPLANVTVLYEIVRELGQKPSSKKGQTVSGAAKQRAEDVLSGAMKGISFS